MLPVNHIVSASMLCDMCFGLVCIVSRSEMTTGQIGLGQIFANLGKLVRWGRKLEICFKIYPLLVIQ